MGFLFIVLLVCLYYGSRGLRKRISHYFNLREEPEPIYPLTDWDIGSHHRTLAKETPPLPEINDSWLGVFKNHSLLNKYCASIDSYRQSVESAATQCYMEFENRHTTLLNQQTQLIRRVFRAKKLIRQFIPELKQLHVSTATLPKGLTIRIPAKPNIPNPNTIARKYPVVSTGAANAVSKSLTQPGGSPAMALAALAISVVQAKSNVSKLKRVVEDTAGQVSYYVRDMRGFIEILKTADTTQIIPTSQQLKEAETHISKLVEDIQALPTQARALSELNEETKSNVIYLYMLTLDAYQLSHTRI